MYSISDLERISGIKAHTIRVWEKRYSLLSPHRTDGNHRLYSDDDVIKLLSVERMIRAGNKISIVARWDKNKMEGELRDLISEEKYDGSDVSDYNNEWLKSAIQYDEKRFCQIYKELRSRMGFIKLWKHYLVPALQHMGNLWLLEDIVPAEEHFFSQLVRRKILAETDQLKVPAPSDNPVLLFLPSMEYHELGLLASEYILRKEGVFTLNLGADIPMENLERFFQFRDIKTLISFMQGFKLNDSFMDFIESLEYRGKQVVLNGLLHSDDEMRISGSSHIINIKTVQEFQEYISRILILNKITYD